MHEREVKASPLTTALFSRWGRWAYGRGVERKRKRERRKERRRRRGHNGKQRQRGMGENKTIISIFRADSNLLADFVANRFDDFQCRVCLRGANRWFRSTAATSVSVKVIPQLLEKFV